MINDVDEGLNNKINKENSIWIFKFQ